MAHTINPHGSPNDRNEAELQAAGEQIIEVLQLKLNRNGRVDTKDGDKTPFGLALTMRSILEGKY